MNLSFDLVESGLDNFKVAFTDRNTFLMRALALSDALDPDELDDVREGELATSAAWQWVIDNASVGPDRRRGEEGDTALLNLACQRANAPAGLRTHIHAARQAGVAYLLMICE